MSVILKKQLTFKSGDFLHSTNSTGRLHQQEHDAVQAITKLKKNRQTLFYICIFKNTYKPPPIHPAEKWMDIFKKNTFS